MARGNYFKHNVLGYKQVLQGPDALSFCEAEAARIAAAASAISGDGYDIDSVPGLNRIHTRVTTLGNWPARMHEIKTHALAKQGNGGGLRGTLLWRWGDWKYLNSGKRVKRGSGGYVKTKF